MSKDLRHQLAGVQSCRELLSKDPRDSIIEYVVGCVKMFAVHWSTFNLCRRSIYSHLWRLFSSKEGIYNKQFCICNFLPVDHFIDYTEFQSESFWFHLRWHGSHSAEVNENINLDYSQDQGYS